MVALKLCRALELYEVPQPAGLPGTSKREDTSEMTDYRYGLAAALAGFTFSAAALAAPPSYTLTKISASNPKR